MTIAEALKKEGQKNRDFQLINNMLKNDMTAKQIAQVTELELDYVEQLSKQQQDKNTKH